MLDGRSTEAVSERLAWGVFAAALLGFLAQGVTLPVLPRYVHGPLHSGDLAVGVVIGAFAVTAIATRPFAGRMADVHGRRPVVLAGLALCALGGVVLLLPLGVGGLVLSRFAVGAGQGAVFTAGLAWTVDLAAPARRGRAMGLFGLSVWIAMSLGPLAGEVLRSELGYRAVWIGAVVAPLAGIVVARALPEGRERRAGVDDGVAGGDRPPAGGGAATDEMRGARRGSLVPRAALAPGIALALAAVGYATLASFVVLHLEARGIAHAPLAFVAFATAIVLMRTVAGRLPDVIGGRRSALGATALETLGLALVAFAPSLPLALLGSIVMGAGFSVLFPSYALLVVARSEPQKHGVALGAFTAFFDAGVGLGGLLAGAVAAALSYEAAFVAASGFALAALVATVLDRGPAAASHAGRGSIGVAGGEGGAVVEPGPGAVTRGH